MRTLHVDLGASWRGGQNQVLLLLRGLRARGHAAKLVVPTGSPLARRAAAEGFAVDEIQSPLLRLATARRLRQLLAYSPTEILHAHDAHALTAAWLALARRRCRVVASRRVAYPLSAAPWARPRYQTAGRILAVSRFVAESCLRSGVPASRVEVVYSGIELPPLPSEDERRRARQCWGFEPDSPVVANVGYLLPEKGQETLLRSLPALRARFPALRLLLAGDGPCRPRLEQLAEELGVSDAVCFAGFVDDVAAFHAALDVFAFPSIAEPLGTSLLAAMAAGCPVVATESGAGREVVEHGRTGLLVPPQDVAALAEAIRALLDDPGRAAALGSAARRVIAERFSADRMVEETLRVYETLLQQGDPP